MNQQDDIKKETDNKYGRMFLSLWIDSSTLQRQKYACGESNASALSTANWPTPWILRKMKIWKRWVRKK